MKKSCVQIYTGSGKGKTTAAIGLAVRALGRGKSVKFAQFLKGRSTGEMVIFKQLPGAEFFQVSECKKFFPDMTESEKAAVKSEAQEFLSKIHSWLGIADIIVLDEALGALSNGLLSVIDIVSIIEKRQGTEIVLTGRDVPKELIELADLVTEMKEVKHYFESGVSAREGIEY